MEGQASITTGTVALLFKPHAIPSVEATTLKKFSALSVLSVDKKIGCPTIFFAFFAKKVFYWLEKATELIIIINKGNRVALCAALFLFLREFTFTHGVMMPIKEDYRMLIERVYAKLGKRKKCLADKILSNPLDIIEMSVAAFAESCGCDQTTVVRFAQQIGYSGYSELKLAIAQKSEALWKMTEANSNENMTEHETLCRNIIQTYDQVIKKTLMQISEKDIMEVAVKIEKASSIMICGAGASALAADDLAFKLARLGVHVISSRDQEVVKCLIGNLRKKDVLIIFSHFGETAPFPKLIQTANSNGVETVGITSIADSSVGKFSKMLLQTNSGGELPIRLGAMTSRTSQMIVSDLITIVYSKLDKKRSWERLEAAYVSYNG